MSDGRPPGERGDDDAVFAEIVARWDDPDPVRPPRPAGPTAAGDDAASAEAAPDAQQTPETERAPGPDEPPEARRRPVAGAGSPADPDAWRAHRLADEPDEDFAPSAPAPLPRGEFTFWAALVGLVTGPVWLLYLVVAQPYGSRVPMVLAALLTVAGFAALVARSPRRRRDGEDDGDDGAVV